MQRYARLLLVLAVSGCAPNTKDSAPSVDVDADGDGVPQGDDCDDTDIERGDIRDDADCDGARTEVDCDPDDPAVGDITDDADCDGAFTATDCDDSDTSLGSRLEDADCDGILTAEDCDDTDERMPRLDADCDGLLMADDCDDTDPTAHARSEDADCDGVLAADDCYDNDRWSTTVAEDQDCDGVETADDCDDTDPTSHTRAEDADCDGYNRADDCDDGSTAVHPGMAEVCGDDVDENCDGVAEPCLSYDAAPCPSFLPLDSGAPIATSGWGYRETNDWGSSYAGFAWRVGEVHDVHPGFYDAPAPGFDAASWLPASDSFGGSQWAILSLNTSSGWHENPAYGYDGYDFDDVQALSVACTTAGVVVARSRTVGAAQSDIHSGWIGAYAMDVYPSLPLLLPASVEEGVTWRTEGLSLPFRSTSYTAGFGASASGTTHVVVSCGLETIVGEARNVCHIDSVTDAGDTYAWAVGEGVWHVEDQRGTIAGITAL